MERNTSMYFIVIQSPACLRQPTLTADLWRNILSFRWGNVVQQEKVVWQQFITYT